jgi:aromatic ring-opening dioxygenase LigB subunit
MKYGPRLFLGFNIETTVKSHNTVIRKIISSDEAKQLLSEGYTSRCHEEDRELVDTLNSKGFKIPITNSDASINLIKNDRYIEISYGLNGFKFALLTIVK